MTTPLRQHAATLGHELPESKPHTPHYAPYVRSGNLVFVSGQIPLLRGEPAFIGTLGADFDVAQGRLAAECAALGVLAQIDAMTEGDLSRFKRLSRITVYMAATPAFRDHSLVGHGASELFTRLLGERGVHARTSIGVASLPLGVAVEIDAVVELVS